MGSLVQYVLWDTLETVLFATMATEEPTALPAPLGSTQAQIYALPALRMLTQTVFNALAH